MKEWDQYTIQHEPVSSLELMERAAVSCVKWILKLNYQDAHFVIFCGRGNNGGDGLAIARLLRQHGNSVAVNILDSAHSSPDFEANLVRLQGTDVSINFITAQDQLPEVAENNIIVDALFGYGLNKPLQGLAAAVAEHINVSGAIVISIDLPSGMFPDSSSRELTKVLATHTLTFQTYKTGLLVQENGTATGHAHVLPIGLHPGYLDSIDVNCFYVTDKLVKTIYQPRRRFSHKGTYGHVLLIAGSFGKMGAAVLAAKACIRSGAGLLTCYTPACGFTVMQTAVPEAMVLTDGHEKILTQLPSGIEKYEVIGIGPGIGTADETCAMTAFIMRRYHKPLVIDADALNCISQQPELLDQLPVDSILTPHPKEFDRLFGVHENDFDRIKTAHKKSKTLRVSIILKGHHTLIATREGQLFFNSTGNAGMARGGSGDVLTGVLTGLVASGYAPQQAAILGVYLHGLAGDFAANALSKEAMTPTDMISFLSHAFLQLTEIPGKSF